MQRFKVLLPHYTKVFWFLFIATILSLPKYTDALSCVRPAALVLDTLQNDQNDLVVEITVQSSINSGQVPVQIYSIDTISRQELLDTLVSNNKSHYVTIIGKIESSRPYEIQEPTDPSKYLIGDSVTFTIKRYFPNALIKGPPIPFQENTQFTFAHEHSWKECTNNGGTQQCLTYPHWGTAQYDSLVGETFIGFVSSKTISALNNNPHDTTKMKLVPPAVNGPCSFGERRGFFIDSDNNITYEGLTSHNDYNGMPGVSVPLQSFLRAIGTTRIRHRAQLSGGTIGQPFTMQASGIGLVLVAPKVVTEPLFATLFNYKGQQIGRWRIPEGSRGEIRLPPANNVLGHGVYLFTLSNHNHELIASESMLLK